MFTLIIIKTYRVLMSVLYCISFLIHSYLFVNIVFRSQRLNTAFRNLIFMTHLAFFLFDLILVMARIVVIFPNLWVIMDTVFVYLPSEYGRVAVGVAFSLLLLSVDCMICVTWERYFALIKLESSHKLTKYRVILYTVATANSCFTCSGYIFILVRITTNVAQDKLPYNQNMDIDYYKTLENHPNIFLIDKLSSESLYCILALGVFATCSRVAIGVPAIRLFKSHIRNRSVSNSTVGIIRMMERLVYLQIVIIFTLAVFPAWFMVMLLFVFNTWTYASELFMGVVLVITLSPMTLAVSTICAVKPYHAKIVEVVNYFRVKVKPITVSSHQQSRFNVSNVVYS